MKRFSILLCILTAFLFFDTPKASAQKATKSKRFIIIELSVPGYDVETLKVPISKPNKTGYGVGGGMGCGECDAGQPSDVLYNADALKLKNKITVNFQITVDGVDDVDKRRIRKNFAIYYNRKTFVKLKYGIKLVTYYNPKNKKAN